MKRLNIPATRSNVIRIKDELALARSGKELLDQKKEILINNINLLADKADHVRQQVDRQLRQAYQALKQALLEDGEAAVEAAGLAVRAGEQVVIRERSLMGVVMPIVHARVPKLRPEYSLTGTGPALDRVRGHIHEVLEVIAELAELEVGVRRLLKELKKTLKRINALDHIYIPQYEATLKSMRETLEEKEREALFKMKRMRQRQTGPP